MGETKGSAGPYEAARHWSWQRLSALALIPLVWWLVLFAGKVLHAGYAETLAWLREPMNSLAWLALWAAALYHAALGCQVVLEDYVSEGPKRTQYIIATRLAFAVLAALAAGVLGLIHLG